MLRSLRLMLQMLSLLHVAGTQPTGHSSGHIQTIWCCGTLMPLLLNVTPLHAVVTLLAGKNYMLLCYNGTIYLILRHSDHSQVLSSLLPSCQQYLFADTGMSLTISRGMRISNCNCMHNIPVQIVQILHFPSDGQNCCTRREGERREKGGWCGIRLCSCNSSLWTASQEKHMISLIDQQLTGALLCYMNFLLTCTRRILAPNCE